MHGLNPLLHRLLCIQASTQFDQCRDQKDADGEWSARYEGGQTLSDLEFM